jgi:hypothetical protein
VVSILNLLSPTQGNGDVGEEEEGNAFQMEKEFNIYHSSTRPSFKQA